MRNKILLIIVVIIGSIILIGVFVLKKSSVHNGFKRYIVNANIKSQYHLEFKDKINFAWQPKHEIWLQNRKEIFTLSEMTNQLKYLKIIKLKIPIQFNSSLRNYYYDRVGTFTYIINETGEITIYGNHSSSYFKIPNQKFDDPIALSRNSIVVRSYKVTGQKISLQISKIKILEKARIQKSYNIPGDETFSADGILRYDEFNSKIYYLYYRKGEFLCLDTNLTLLYKAKTIDTVNTAKLQYATYYERSKDGKLLQKKTISSPSSLVNRYYTITEDRIYIHSGLIAENQDYTDFFFNNPIDVYSKKQGRYLYSFNIPKYRNISIGQFYIKGDTIAAIHGSHLNTYTFKEPHNKRKL